MRNIRRTAMALGAATALALGAAGCGDSAANGPGGDAGNQPVAAEVADPRATLDKAVTELGRTSMTVQAKLGEDGSLTGAVDQPNKRGRLNMTVAVEGAELTVDTTVIGTDMYMKMDLGGVALPGTDPDAWMHLDLAKLPANNRFGLRPGEFDPADAAKFLRSVATAEAVDDRRIKGTMDLSKAVGAAGIEATDVEALDAAAKAMPFEATVDDEGRLSTLVLDTPAMAGQPAQRITVTYSDFGAPVEVSKPSGKIVEAPEEIYDTLTA